MFVRITKEKDYLIQQISVFLEGSLFSEIMPGKSQKTRLLHFHVTGA